MRRYNRPMATDISRSNSLKRLVSSTFVVADELAAFHEQPPQGDITDRKLVVTFAGAFEFHVGSSATWIDSGRILFAYPGESYVDHHVVDRTGHNSIILTPSDEAVHEVWGPGNPGRVRAGSLRIQMMAQLLRRATSPLAAQELAVALLYEGMADDRRVSMVDQRCVRLAKAALHDCGDGKINLDMLAANIGVSPAQLTQCFKKSEGIPLYRYQTLLRLGRALRRLPECEDITDLAFELGFSSHSHFTSAFGAKIGMTPSQFRAEARAR